MSENVRVCQFYLRGRCHREKCEFRHPANVGSGLSQNKIKESIASETVRRFNYKSEDEPNDSSDDSDEVRDRSRIRVEREKVVIAFCISETSISNTKLCLSNQTGHD